MSIPDDTAERLRRLHAAHEELSSLPGEMREAYLARLRKESPHLAAELEKLLETPDDPSLDEPLHRLDSPGSSSTVEDPERIGPYRILERIGEGGMGSVYLAEQEKPIRRRVAIKIIKVGMDTREVISRFEAERQALALMDHPGVARVLEAGATDSGRPYFVMEHVPGTSITDYCDRNRLDIRGRLELLAATCRAIHHAHQKGIIHRDVKPSNILVTIREGRPAPKVIDFGVSKATNQRITEHTIYTEHGRLIGTPDYMSPEQAELTGLDVDTSTDIYSLGVILYEILTGSLPFEANPTHGPGWSEIRKTIREVDPPTPSTRVRQLGTDAEDAASRRRIDPATLGRSLRGELDWIVMKAIEKDRTRRYTSAAEMAQDIDNYLTNEPVIAGPPGAGYRLRKALARHRGWVVTAGTVTALFVAGAATVTGLYVRSERARAEAILERDRAKHLGEFLMHMLSSANPYSKSGGNPTVDALFDRAVAEIEAGALGDQPETGADILLRIGTVYRLIGEHDSAARACSAGVAILEDRYGSSSVNLLEPLCLMVQANLAGGRSGAARRMNRRALEICETNLSPGDSLWADHLAQAATLNRLAGRYAAADSLIVKAIENCEGSDSPYGAAWHRLARCNILLDMGQIGTAERMGEEAHRFFVAFRGEEAPEVAHSLYYLGMVRARAGDDARAEGLLRESLEIARETLGADHPFLSNVFEQLGSVSVARERYGVAEEFYLRGLAIQQAVSKTPTSRWTGCLVGLGRLYTAMGRFGEADSLLSLSAEIQEESPGQIARAMAGNQAARAALCRARGMDRQADSLYAEALAFYDGAGIADHPEAVEIRDALLRRGR